MTNRKAKNPLKCVDLHRLAVSTLWVNLDVDSILWYDILLMHMMNMCGSDFFCLLQPYTVINIHILYIAAIAFCHFKNIFKDYL